MSLTHFDLTGSPATVCLREMVQGKTVTLIGSAPGVRLTAEDIDHNLMVCVNGAALGLAGNMVPDITFVNTALAGPHPAAVKTRKRLEELQTRSLFIIESFISLSDANPALSRIKRKSTQSITLRERCDFLEAVLQRPLSGQTGDEHVPSTGFFVCLLLVACGAFHVRMTGFSFSDGHSYLSSVARRQHVDRDREVLKLLVESSMPVTFPAALASIVDDFRKGRREASRFTQSGSCRHEPVSHLRAFVQSFPAMTRQLLGRLALLG